jgi:hypothetical protein
MIPIFYIVEEAGAKGRRPFPLHPKSPPTQPSASLRINHA